MPVWSATGGGPCHDSGACHDGGAGGRNCSFHPGKVLHRCHRICGRRYSIQQAVFAESRCRSSAHFLSKGGLCCGTGCRTQRKIRKSAAALRSHHAPAGCQSLAGVYGAADLELCAEPVRKKIDYLSPHRQPIFDGGYGRITAEPCIRNGCDFWRRRKTSGSCAAGNQRKQGHGPPRAAAYGKCGKGRPFCTACR